MFNFFCQSLHVTNFYVILFLASAKTVNTGILVRTCCTLNIYVHMDD